MTSTEKPAGGISLPARTIPAPTTISSEAQAFLSREMPIKPPQFAHDDLDAWRAHAAQTEPMLEAISRQRAAPYPAEVVDIQGDGWTLYEITPDTLDPAQLDKAVFHIHGGAFVVGGGRTAAYAAQSLASATGLRTFSVDYRMPPGHPFPRGVDDCIEAYSLILKRYAPERIAFHGSSAGANLAAASILKARDQGMPLPGAAALHTAGVDMTQSGDTFTTNVGIDVVLQAALPGLPLLYSGGHDPAHPYLSPAFADLSKGFPPTILLSGTRDILLSPTVMMHRALLRAGREAELHVWEAMPHGGFGGSAPEDRELLEQTARFIKSKLGAA
jgi:acetyl esterase/lipase